MYIIINYKVNFKFMLYYKNDKCDNKADLVGSGHLLKVTTLARA